MATSQTSVLSSATLDALGEKLTKLAEAEGVKPDDSKKALKRTLRTVSLAALGYGAGHAAGMLGEKVLAKKFGARWAQVAPEGKRKLLIPAAGILTAATAALGSEIATERERRKNRDG